MPLKILHTGDIHLGAKFLSLGDKGSEQREQLLATFDSILDLALAENVDLLLIAGDLFDSQRVSRRLLGRVSDRLTGVAGRGIPVVISPGTHDRYGPLSPYAAPPLSEVESLVIFKSERMAGVTFPELDCTVYGNANTSPFENKYPLAGFTFSDASRWHIGMTHTTFEIPDLVDDTYMVTGEQVAASGLDYLALGHFHSTSDRSHGKVSAFYCGAPEMISAQKGDFGNVLLVELDDGATVRPVRVGRREVREVDLRAEDAPTVAAMESLLQRFADPDTVLRVTVEGLRGAGCPDFTEVERELADSFFSVSIHDRSRPAPDTLDPEAYPGGSPAKVYLEILSSKLSEAPDASRDEILEAMQLGLSLLGQGCG